MSQPSADAALGRIGRPAALSALAAARWDAIVVGAGHNGLACAAYLARAGRRVLVLEARERVGGACTLEETWPGYRVSPCAYLAGLLHPVVIEELGLARRGFQWVPAAAGLFVPFDDGESVQLWEDAARCEAEVRRLAPRDVAGFRAMGALKDALRDALRPDDPDRDLWLGPAPTRDAIEKRLEQEIADREQRARARQLLFEWSMVGYLDHFLDDERLKLALMGQGVIGTNASPHDPGTASIHFHHQSGRMGGQPGVWGYVRGGMGRVSFLLCDAAREAGASVAAGVAVERIVPGEGVEAEGLRIGAPVVVSNADPATTLRLLGADADPAWRERVEAIPMRGCTVKLSVALRELPSFAARPGTDAPHHRGQVNTPLSRAEWHESHRTAREGRLPARLWTELYFHSALDRSVVPEGRHVMSVFAQYVPYAFAEGSWDTRRAEVGELALASLARHCTNVPGCIEAVEVLGPPDIEAKTGLAGGHIFQGECLPSFLWANRLPPRTPMPGVFLCGAGTHPGGSVIAANGRNAAREILGGTG